MLDGGADAQLSTVYHDFSPITDPMLRKLELFNPCRSWKPKLQGRSELTICSEVLKVCSSDAFACSRNFLESRMIEAKVGLESQKGHLLDNLDARNAIVGT
jgi:hypothetical protein